MREIPWQASDSGVALAKLGAHLETGAGPASRLMSNALRRDLERVGRMAGASAGHLGRELRRLEGELERLDRENELRWQARREVERVGR